MTEAEIKKIVGEQRSYFHTGATLPVSVRVHALNKLKSCIIEKEEKIKREILQKEIEEKRKAAKQEIERYQAEQTDMLKKRIQDFGSQYHLYLSKIYQASEMLNNTALQIGNTFLENDTNISELFRVQTKDSLGNLTLGKEHPNPESEGPKVNVVPFLLWEDAPAEKKSQDM